MYVGSSSASEWISKDFNLGNWLGGSEDDDLGWKVLEVVHLVSRGMLLWVNAVEYLFLFVIFALLFISVRSQKNQIFTTRWAYLGSFLALLSIIDFAAEVLRFESWRTFSRISWLIGILSRLILFPVWLVWLGKQMPGAEGSLSQSVQASQSEMVGVLTDSKQPEMSYS